MTYSVEPGTKSEEALSLLGTWAATLADEERGAKNPASPI
jgi:hypothetical protein